MDKDKKIFVPFSEELIEMFGLGLGDLVPFDLEYECLHFLESAHEPVRAGKTDLTVPKQAAKA